VPAVLVGCCRPDGSDANLITVAWAGTVNSEPPLVSVSIRPERHSHPLIRGTGEFSVNMPTASLAWGLDFCGVRSGRDTDKWAATGMVPEPASAIRPPLVAQCPVSLECRVRSSHELGTHTMFLGEIVAVRVDPRLVDRRRLVLGKAGLLAYAHGHYYALGRALGSFGWSVRRKARAVRRAAR